MFAATSATPTLRSSRSSIRAQSAERSARRTGPPPARSPLPRSWRPAVWRSTPSRRCCQSGCTPDGVAELLGFGWHVNLQKPICGELPDAQRMLDAAKASGAILRVMENYLFYEPLRKLKATIESGQIGDVAGYHLKMVGSGNGGWDVPWSSFELQMEQMKRGRGIFVFDA